MVNCEKCKRELKDGDEVFQSEWKDIQVKGDETKIKLVYKYECAPSCPPK